MSDISLETLLESGAHFGHQTKRWNPHSGPYVYGVKGGVHIFDLIKTKKALQEALEAINKASSQGKSILILGTKKQAKDKVKEVAIEKGILNVTERWLGGTITNFDQVKRSITKLKDMKEDMAQGKYKNLTKKERLLIERKINKLEIAVGGISDMQQIPDFMIIIDTHREHAAVAEAKKMKIPTVGIVDSNANPEEVTWPIPMNDDSSQALDYVITLIGENLKTSKPKETKVKTKK